MEDDGLDFIGIHAGLSIVSRLAWEGAGESRFVQPSGYAVVIERSGNRFQEST